MSSMHPACSVGTPCSTTSDTLVMEVLLDTTCSIVELEIPVQISIPAMRVAAGQEDLSHTLYRYRTISSFILLRMFLGSGRGRFIEHIIGSKSSSKSLGLTEFIQSSALVHSEQLQIRAHRSQHLCRNRWLFYFTWNSKC